MSTDIHIRFADRSDRDAVRAMQELSLRTLGVDCYDEDVIEAYIEDVGTMDDTLLDDGTYFLAESQGELVGSGGWSWRTPGYAARAVSEGAVGSVRDATVRSIFVHPAWARHGVARAVMATVESEIAAAGFASASLMATLTGIPFYRRLGYRGGEPVAVKLRDGLTFAGLLMRKQLAAAGEAGACAA